MNNVKYGFKHKKRSIKISKPPKERILIMKAKTFSSFIFIIVILLIVEGEASMTYAKDALFLCGNMIIPSLFPFFVCSGILVYSGFCQKLSVLFAPVMKPLFNVNPNGSSAFVLGLMSGYPLGAVTACQLYEAGYISKSETERLLAFCNNSGPLFILTSVGVGLYMGIDIGIILYSAHIIGAILVGIIMRSYSKEKHHAPSYTLSTDTITLPQIFETAVSNAVKSMLTVCGTIIFFSVISRLILGLIPGQVSPIIYGLFEFSGGNVMISTSSLPLPLKLISASIITGFAGFSVHLQVMSVTCRYGLSVKPYIIGKILHGLLSGAITVLIINFTQTIPTFKNCTSTLYHNITMASIYMTVCIISLIIITLFLGLHKKRNCRNKQQFL